MPRHQRTLVTGLLCWRVNPPEMDAGDDCASGSSAAYAVGHEEDHHRTGHRRSDLRSPVGAPSLNRAVTMGMFSRKKPVRPAPKPYPQAAASKPKGKLVRVAFRELTQPVPDNGPSGRYVYRWPFLKPPTPGQWVIVPSDFGRGTAVVTGPGTVTDAQGMPIKTVERLVTASEIATAHQKADADARAWLRMAEHAAGFPCLGKPRQTPPYGYPPIPPADGQAPTPDAAQEWAYVWGQAHKLAEERGLSEARIKKFKSIRQRWSAVARKM